jgi:hypothetical protein
MRRLPDYPVIVVHLEDPAGSGLAACCGLPLVKLRQGEGYHYWPCTGCKNAGKPAEARAAVLRELREEVAGMEPPEHGTDWGVFEDNGWWAAQETVLAAIDRRIG